MKRRIRTIRNRSSQRRKHQVTIEVVPTRIRAMEIRMSDLEHIRAVTDERDPKAILARYMYRVGHGAERTDPKDLREDEKVAIYSMNGYPVSYDEVQLRTGSFNSRLIVRSKLSFEVVKQFGVFKVIIQGPK